ncbi:TetR/AcrR family transcriptional regulator [Jiangella mangrovi]|uniref:AcrR family transcriptional regulator n=1 Tax=Jiangella mangrovi TaxID=1524084 RepID=A0A7W9GR59_9ACTN|nr:TetR/AcrR family transcriptional regulator [Jiangella mangrovi]MBB5788505.1 AcrR family transcriptional regulator [Jiangella mangrovi]
MVDPVNEAGSGPERPPSRRERARAATIEEIKQTAMGLMREQGTTDFRFSDIARLMGMTAPALYRYFADRDELLTALIVDAYDDLGTAVAAARDQVPLDDPGGRFTAVAQSYRRWAREEPQRFALILGPPVPGYHAPEEGPTTEAARRAMAQLKSLFYEAAQAGVLRKPMLGDDGTIARLLAEHHEPKEQLPIDGPPVPPETFQAMLHCWSSMHGFASLEAYGHLEWLPIELRDAVFESSIRLVAKVAGLPEPITGPS